MLSRLVLLPLILSLFTVSGCRIAAKMNIPTGGPYPEHTADAPASDPSLSEDATISAFSSLSDTLVAGDSNGVADVFVRSGNITTLNVAFCEIYNEQTFGREPKVICRQRNWFDGKAIRDKIKELYGDKDGSHATISEVSMTQYLFPDHIKTVGEEMGPPSNWRGGFRDAEDYRSKFPDGRIGAHSWLATPSDGEAFYKLAVDEVAADYRKFLAGEFG